MHRPPALCFEGTITLPHCVSCGKQYPGSPVAGTRPGFFLGDGAGVGKGRQIGGLIKEFWATGGRRVSVNGAALHCHSILCVLSWLSTQRAVSYC